MQVAHALTSLMQSTLSKSGHMQLLMHLYDTMKHHCKKNSFVLSRCAFGYVRVRGTTDAPRLAGEQVLMKGELAPGGSGAVHRLG